MNTSDKQPLLKQMLTQVDPTGKSVGLAERLQQESQRGREAINEILIAPTLESFTEPQQLADSRMNAELALESLEVMHRGSELTPNQQFQLEAIVLPFHRPVVDVVNDSLVKSQLTDHWVKYGEDSRRAFIVERTRAIGRINVPTLRSLPYAGTGFIVGDGLLMTNRHVAAIFSQGIGSRSVRIPAGTESVIEFSDSGESLPTSLRVREVVMIHPYWDMALLRVDGLPADRLPLTLSTTDPTTLIDREVAVVGYPGYDPSGTEDYQAVQRRVFNGKYYVKRFQPGNFRVREPIESFQKLVNAVTHDCSTLGGNSGSAVLDLTTGEVVGLHFGGIYLKANYAVSPLDLAQDSRVVDAGVNFRGRVEPRGHFYGPIWRQAEGLDSPPPPPTQPTSVVQTMTSTPATPTMTWTIPLQVTVSIGAPTHANVPVSVAPVTGTAVEGAFGAAPPLLVSDDRFVVDALQASPFGFPGALSLGLASRLSYRTEAEVTQVAATGWGLEARIFNVDDTQCFAARIGSTAFVAFRGTESRGDWLGNLNMLSTTRPYGVVHRGFLSAFQVVAQPLEQLLSAWNTTAIWLTGHSLGGALATIAAAEWYGRFPIAGISTYGQPAVGKGVFGDFMKRNYRGRFFRYVNDDDIVPRVPPTYRHVGQLIHFSAAGVPAISVESLNSGELFQPSVISAPEQPMMTEAEFDRMRAELLQQQAAVKTEGFESLSEMRTEGLFPSVRDHSLERYLEKIAKRISLS